MFSSKLKKRVLISDSRLQIRILNTKKIINDIDFVFSFMQKQVKFFYKTFLFSASSTDIDLFAEG